MERATVAVAVVQADWPDCDDKSRRLVVTTDEEIDGFQIIRAIVCSEVAVSRVTAHGTLRVWRGRAGGWPVRGWRR